MTRALDLRQEQVTALIRGAAKAGCIAVVKIGEVVIHLVPADSPQVDGRIDQTINPANFQTLEEWDAWKERKRAREAQGRS